MAGNVPFKRLVSFQFGLSWIGMDVATALILEFFSHPFPACFQAVVKAIRLTRKQSYNPCKVPVMIAWRCNSSQERLFSASLKGGGK
jgi:hypothetical protein